MSYPTFSFWRICGPKFKKKPMTSRQMLVLIFKTYGSSLLKVLYCTYSIIHFYKLKAPFSLSRFKVPVHPGLMIRDEPCHNRGGTMDNLGDPG